MLGSIVKRDGRIATFDEEKITQAIYKAATKVGGNDIEIAKQLASEVSERLSVFGIIVPDVETVQNEVEKVLMENGHTKTSKAFILYRAERSRVREMNTSLMKTYEELTFSDASEIEVKRENANIDGDSAMGTMLRYGSEGAKKFNLLYVIPPKIAEAHKNGDIHIHDLDFYTLTQTCVQLDLEKLFTDGFNTGHGFLREPGEIRSYAALACIAIQSCQNDMHGGQSIPAFDHYMAPGVAKTFVKEIIKVLHTLYKGTTLTSLKKELKNYRRKNRLIMNDDGLAFVREAIVANITRRLDNDEIERIIEIATEYTEEATQQAMEAAVHNLNSMHSRAGAQVPFSSLNYGTDKSTEGRLVTRSILLATESGLGDGETPIFPIQIFKLKKGVNLPGDINYDLFKLACRVSAKRLFPNFSNLDAPYNAIYYKEGRPETEVAYMGCRTRVIGNTYDPENEIVTGRGNLSFTTINLPRLGLEAGPGNLDEFYELLDNRLQLVEIQLLERYRTQCKKRPKNFPFLMGQGVWMESDTLGPDDDISEVIKHGTLSIGFIGLAETLVALLGKHHGESEEAQQVGLEIIGRLRDFCDVKSEEYDMNFSVLATPAEGISGRFIGMDQKLYGDVPGVTDKDYYTNSFHVPVYYNVSAFKKIKLEAPYHALCNAGHITYIEVDGDPGKNLEAFEKVVMYMYDHNIGYGAINHPVDRDPICGYTGLIDDSCPRCGRKEGQPMTTDMWNKIKGYTGNADTFGACGNPDEEADRVVNLLDWGRA